MIVLMVNYFLKGAMFSSYYNFVTFLLLNLLMLNLMICVSSLNIMHSMLFLMLSFFCLSSMLFMLNLKFMGMLILLVYGGAMSMLLLFVLMMLDMKFLLFDMKISFKYFLSLFLFCLVLQFLLVIYSNKSLVYSPIYLYIDWMKMLYMQDELVMLGDLLYNKNLFFLLIMGMMLLSALMGSMSMVSNKKSARDEIMFNQLEADTKKMLFFNKKKKNELHL